MGIKVSTKTKATKALKLYNSISSYLFEEEFGELRGVSSTDISKLKEAKQVLSKIISGK